MKKPIENRRGGAIASTTSDDRCIKSHNLKNTSEGIISPILPNGKYKTIYADPPWDIQQKGMGRGAQKHYDLMTIEQIKAMPIADLAEDNAHLWLWTTNAALPYAFDVIKAWGFEYRSIFTAVKLQLSLGVYLRNCTEQILFATRGNCPIEYRAQQNYTFFSRQEHSRKPGEIYDIIERCSKGPYLELFARHSDKYPKRDFARWSYWGNEIESDIAIPGYPVPDYSERVKILLPDSVKGGSDECKA